MPRFKVSDQVKTIHPLAGQWLAGEILVIVDRSPKYDGVRHSKAAKFAQVRFDSGAVDWVAIESLFTCAEVESLIIEDENCRSSTKPNCRQSAVSNSGSSSIDDQKRHKKTLGGQTKSHVIELGKQPIQKPTPQAVQAPSLTLNISPPARGGSIAVSLIYAGSPGWVESKTIKGRQYYYLRGDGIPQRYLGSNWAKALDRLKGYIQPAVPGNIEIIPR